MLPNVKSFLSQCQKSSHEAYQAFKALLSALEQPTSRSDACKLLHQVFASDVGLSESKNHFHCFTQTVLNEQDQQVTLNLFQFPSTFMPEAWSFTFYEGLVRYPASEYSKRQVIELGCGIGWITLGLALRYAPTKITGVDINPKAIVCARINLFLNAFDENGYPKILSDGRNLFDVVAFHESNLLDRFKRETDEFDKIIGCIPQVLNPQPEVMENLVAETSSDEYLYSLSNYFAKQGYIEDQFGLGLIASAVEQSIPLLKSSGKLILNLGGRPGRAVLERLMQRRGFSVRRVWQTQVEQAADTDIDALVDIEKTTGHRFEFYMSDNTEVSIDARTAAAYAQAGGHIYHSVDVYEAQLVFPEKVKQIFSAIQTIKDNESLQQEDVSTQHYDALCSAVDLTYDRLSDAEERFSFLGFLANYLQKKQAYPYGETAGLTNFRQQLAEYFRYYLRVDVTENQVMINPGRRELITSLLKNFKPKRTIVASSLNELVLSASDYTDELIEAPQQVEFLCELIEKLAPQLVITKFDEHELQSDQLVGQLIDCAERNNALLVIDLSDNVDLSSQPQIHGVYRYLSNHAISSNLIVMAGLMNNHVYQHYSLNITLTDNAFIMNSLIDSAELTYSRTPLLKQLYYAHLLEELLFFQRTRTISTMERKAQQMASAFPLALSVRSERAFAHPAITGNRLEFNQQTIRLDYGENELPAPEVLNIALFESYLIRKTVAQEDDPTAAIKQKLFERFNLPAHFADKLVLGNGVAPIFSACLQLCQQSNKKIIIPSGSYGYFVAAGQYEDLEVITLDTRVENDFKISPDDLEKILKENPGAWLFINAPIVNPTGAIYSSEELTEILDLATEYDSTVLLDTIFCGLEFDQEKNWDIQSSINHAFYADKGRIVLMGGISKEFSAGGIRFGYAWSTARDLLNKLDELLVHKPHFTLRYAVRKLIEAQISHESSLQKHLQKQRDILCERAARLTALLERHGWVVQKGFGGLFLVAKPEQFIEENQLGDVEGGDRITDLIFQQQNLVINNSTWTGLPGYCRFVLSCESAAFDEAINRLEAFHNVS